MLITEIHWECWAAIWAIKSSYEFVNTGLYLFFFELWSDSFGAIFENEARNVFFFAKNSPPSSTVVNIEIERRFAVETIQVGAICVSFGRNDLIIALHKFSAPDTTSLSFALSLFSFTSSLHPFRLSTLLIFILLMHSTFIIYNCSIILYVLQKWVLIFVCLCMCT